MSPGNRAPADWVSHVETLFKLWRQGMIAPKISETFPLECAGEAIAAMAERRVIGKLVVRLD